MGGGGAAELNSNIFNKTYRRALIFCGCAVIGAVLYGYDGTYYTSILDMDKFALDYGDQQSDGSYAISTQVRSVVRAFSSFCLLFFRLT